MLEEAERLAKRWEKNREQAEERRLRAQSFARELAVTLGNTDPSVRTILGFGSTFETWRQYREDSDIDLALLKAELTQDYDYIVLNGEKNAIAEARRRRGADYMRLDPVD